MTTLVLGAYGQVGSALRATLGDDGAHVFASRSDIDLEKPDLIVDYLLREKPACIVNAAAYTQVDLAESEEEKAFAVNSTAVEILAKYAFEHDATLVHYSTDYVFDGETTAPYLETDSPAPINVYGKSKWSGEQKIISSGCRYIIFRTSWVISAVGKNFIKTILRLARERDSLNVVNDQIGSPTSANLIARVTKEILLSDSKDPIEKGIYHLASSGVTTWFDVARFAIKTANERDFKTHCSESDVLPITTSQYPLPAARPRNSKLNAGKLEKIFGKGFPRWERCVEEVVREIVEGEVEL
jgi:dTDP-4-dehydrorhamnose reductase